MHIFGTVCTITEHRNSCLASSTRLSAVGEFTVDEDEQPVVLRGSARRDDVEVQ